jgi:hypothetical protein
MLVFSNLSDRRETWFLRGTLFQWNTLLVELEANYYTNIFVLDLVFRLTLL